MGFFKRAGMSLEQRVAKHKEDFSEIADDIAAAVSSVRQQQSVLLEKENNLLALQNEHLDA